jgi:hypothetical protein
MSRLAQPDFVHNLRRSIFGLHSSLSTDDLFKIALFPFAILSREQKGVFRSV